MTRDDILDLWQSLHGEGFLLYGQQVRFGCLYATDHYGIVAACRSHGFSTEIDIEEHADALQRAALLRNLLGKHKRRVEENSAPPDWRPDEALAEDFYAY